MKKIIVLPMSRKEGFLFAPIVLSKNRAKLMNYLLMQKSSPNLTRLSKDLKMSIALLSYHVNGAKNNIGLKDMGLIKVDKKGKEIFLSLTESGALVITKINEAGE